ncbi:hypothetical protein H7X68_01905 [Candidatus Saccharibacteria bacterium]|nr:hypothetical protein [Candidatus Saccharibacteria bacterium]
MGSLERELARPECPVGPRQISHPPDHDTEPKDAGRRRGRGRRVGDRTPTPRGHALRCCSVAALAPQPSNNDRRP